MTSSAQPRPAVLYRMVMDGHVCPYGLKAKDLLRRQGYAIEDRWLRTREQVDAFKAEQAVATTPQVFIGGARIGGYDDLRRHLGKPVADPGATSYRPVVALFAMTALMALGVSHAAYGTPFTLRAAEWFVGFSMAVLALLKLQNIESFATMFLNYDLLAQRWVPYSYVYPFAEGLAGVLMIAGVLTWASVPIALVIGGIGAVSVVKAVYIDRRAEMRLRRRVEQRAAGFPVADRESDDGRDGGVDGCRHPSGPVTVAGDDQRRRGSRMISKPPLIARICSPVPSSIACSACCGTILPTTGFDRLPRASFVPEIGQRVVRRNWSSARSRRSPGISIMTGSFTHAYWKSFALAPDPIATAIMANAGNVSRTMEIRIHLILLGGVDRREGMPMSAR